MLQKKNKNVSRKIGTAKCIKIAQMLQRPNKKSFSNEKNRHILEKSQENS